MVKFVDPAPSPMSNEQIMDLADECRTLSGHEVGRTMRELIIRMGGIIDPPNVEKAIGPFLLAEGRDNRFLIRSNSGLSVPARIMNEATAVGHYILHRPQESAQDEYLLVMAPSLNDSSEIQECRRQARLYAASFLAPRDLVSEMLHDGKCVGDVAEAFKIPYSDALYTAMMTQMGVNIHGFHIEEPTTEAPAP